MSNGILPTLLVLTIIRKVPHNVLVDAVKGESLFRTATNRHHNQSVVAVRRLLLGLFVLIFGL